MRTPLEAHKENVEKNGPLKRRSDVVRDAIAELQAALAKVDPSFKPKHGVTSETK